MKEQGIIIRALSGFYYVFVPRSGKTVSCRARGKFRSQGLSPLVGDRVEIQTEDGETGSVTDIRPRRNAFGRPAIANVDALIMLVSEALPVTDPWLSDRVTVRCEKNGVDAMIVINKCDLVPGDTLREIYTKAGYPVFQVSAETGAGIDALRRALGGKTCCFTGNSGVGKSSVLNALCPGLALITGEVSQKLGRGRHTTRHVELFDIGGGILIADTPGFASFQDESEEPIYPEELAELFPEFSEYRNTCRFDDCTHRKEPGCAVRQAMEEGIIHPSRYDSYLRLYEEASQLKRWERK